MRTHAPNLPRRTVALTLPEQDAFALAAAGLACRIEFFAPDWPAVDRARARLSRDGLAARVGVHHRDAYLCPLVTAALAASKSLAVFLTGARSRLTHPNQTQSSGN